MTQPTKTRECLVDGCHEDVVELTDDPTRGWCFRHIPAVKTFKPGVEVAEGVHGTWHYHLREPGKTRALCGSMVFGTKVNLSDWGYVGHLNERYCDKCARLGNTSTVG